MPQDAHPHTSHAHSPLREEPEGARGGSSAYGIVLLAQGARSQGAVGPGGFYLNSSEESLSGRRAMASNMEGEGAWGPGAGLRSISTEVLVPPVASALHEQGRSPFMLPALAPASGSPKSRWMGTSHESTQHLTNILDANNHRTQSPYF